MKDRGLSLMVRYECILIILTAVIKPSVWIFVLYGSMFLGLLIGLYFSDNDVNYI